MVRQLLLDAKKRKGYGGTEAYSPRLVALGKGSEHWTGTIPEFIHELVFASEDSPLNSRQFDGAVKEVLSHYDKATMYCDLKNGYVLKSQKGKKNQSVEQVVASTQQGLESKNVEHGVASTRKGKKKKQVNKPTRQHIRERKFLPSNKLMRQHNRDRKNNPSNKLRRQPN